MEINCFLHESILKGNFDIFLTEKMANRKKLGIFNVQTSEQDSFC
jgi:hypothetical protein